MEMETKQNNAGNGALGAGAPTDGKEYTKVNLSFLDPKAFVKTIKTIIPKSVGGQGFITESLQTLKKHGITYGTINKLVVDAKYADDYAVNEWYRDIQQVLEDNSTLNSIGQVVERTLAINTGIGATGAKLALGKANQILSMADEEATKAISVDGALDGIVANPELKTVVESVKNKYYDSVPAEKCAKIGDDCSNPLGVLEKVEQGAIVYFNECLLLLEGNNVTPIGEVAAQVKHKVDIKYAANTVKTLSKYFNEADNTFVVPLSIGNVVVESGNIELNGSYRTGDELLKAHSVYARIHGKGINNMSKLREDDKLVMSVNYLSEHFDNFAVLDSIYKCGNHGVGMYGRNKTQYVIVLENKYHIMDVFHNLNASINIKSYTTLTEALETIDSASARASMKGKFKELLLGESIAARSTDKMVRTMTVALSKVDEAIVDIEGAIKEMGGVVYQAGNVEIMKGTLTSLKHKKSTLLAQIAMISETNDANKKQPIP